MPRPLLRANQTVRFLTRLGQFDGIHRLFGTSHRPIGWWTLFETVVLLLPMGTPRWVLDGARNERAAAAQDVEDRVEDIADRPGTGPAAGFLERDERFEDGLFGVGEVAGVSMVTHS